MLLIEEMLISFTLLVFPLFAYLIYSLHVSNFNGKNNLIVLDLCILSSFYLLFCSSHFYSLYGILLLFAYFKERINVGIILSGLMILVFDIYISFAFFIVLHIVYKFYIERGKSCEFLIRYGALILCSYFLMIGGLYEGLFMCMVFLINLIICCFMYRNVVSICNIHISLKDITDEQVSLFKITHEIKNPIAVCKCYLDMFDIEDSDTYSYVDNLKDEMDKILILLQDFLCINKVKIEEDIMDISLLALDVSDSFGTLFKGMNVDFTCDFVDDDIYIMGDYNKLYQVMVNVIKNSVEAKVNDELAITMSMDVVNDNVILTVSDNGMGFDMTDLAKIKEPFYTTKSSGTGLGVVLINEIICAHKGEVIYDSAVGVGTSVKISLPIYDYL